ncbi:MAG: hypothetical protein R6V49_07605 [Bacteroidales bacterium]
MSTYLRFGGVVPSGDALATKGGGDFAYGLFYKRRFSNLSSIIVDYSMQFVSYRVKSIGLIDPYYLIPQWDEETVRTTALTMDLTHRFNFGRRGDQIGKYVDIGGYGSWNLGRTHDYQGSDGNRDIQATFYAADYLSKTEAGLQFGIGYNAIGLYGRYRLTNLLMADHLAVDLPRLIIGVEFTALW